MKIKHYLILFCLVIAAGAIGWWTGLRHSHNSSHSPGSDPGTQGERKIAFYQSAMHPWIKSDKPGKCTICGMALTPVYEGEKGFNATTEVVTLSSNSISVIHLRSEPATIRTLTRQIHFAGTLDDNDSTHRILSSYIEGRIEQLHVNFTGAEVVKGQPLARIYSPALLTAEREYIALVQQESSLSGTVKAETARLRDLAAHRLQRLGLSSDQIQSLPTKPESEVYSEILAPISGTVVSRDVYAGQFVREGDKLFEIADFSVMWLKLDAYERDLPWIQVGQKATITTPSLPGRSWTAPISFIDPNLNEQTRSTKIRIELPNPLVTPPGESTPRREILHRLYATATIQSEIQNILTVPRSAVLASGSDPVVFLDLGEGHYQPRKIKTGRAGDLYWEITEGLNSGDKVVTQAAFLLDAQAQIHRSMHEGSDPVSTTNSATVSPPSSTEKLPPLSQEEKVAWDAYLQAAHTLTRSLAQDQFQSFVPQATQWQEAYQKLTNTLRAALWSQVSPPTFPAQLTPPKDLSEARKFFLPLSQTTANLAQSIARQTGTRTTKVFQCPMTSKSFPGAPKTGLWIQLDSTIMNPFYGAEMLDCGSEVAP